MKITIEQIQRIFKNEVIDKLYKFNGWLYLQYYRFDIPNPPSLH